MVVEDQQDVIAFLSTPAAYGTAGADVRRIDTHSAVVFLCGERAFKLKRAVRYDYLDFSSLERRRAACAAEVALNRRTAPAIYRGIVAVTREADGRLALGGAGAAVDWLVEMARFDEDTLFDRLAARGTLPLDLMPALADAIARFHQDAEPVRSQGGRAGMAWVIDGNESGFAEQGPDILDPDACARLVAATRTALEAQASCLDARRDRGFVRRCHGDLHLRNICLVEGRPTLFDAVEFNEAIACIDVFYDLAFLLMDCWRRQLQEHANLLFNGWLDRTGDYGALPLLPLFLSCRAAVRAKTSATAARLQPDAGLAAPLREVAREYLDRAEAFLRPVSPRLVALGGWSGTGKSSVARLLAPRIGAPPGALVVRSDLVRKALMGAAPLDRLGEDGYTPEVTRRVYDTLASRAGAALAAGQTVVVDAVYGDVIERSTIEAVARAAGVPFVGVWLDAPRDVLAARIGGRTGDASDATVAVLDRQRARALGPLTWERVDARRSLTDVRDAVEARLLP
ncbi:MAG: AAA family ATPase [Acidobacteriota bacterium]|nr:AAA family ATPase [Acidobacteriota bacterium]